MSKPPSVEEILDQARLAVSAYFLGNDRSLTTARFELEGLRAMLRDFDAKQETQRLTKADK